jgi:hypothetical protein
MADFGRKTHFLATKRIYPPRCEIGTAALLLVCCYVMGILQRSISAADVPRSRTLKPSGQAIGTHPRHLRQACRDWQGLWEKGSLVFRGTSWNFNGSQPKSTKKDYNGFWCGVWGCIGVFSAGNWVFIGCFFEKNLFFLKKGVDPKGFSA